MFYIFENVGFDLAATAKLVRFIFMKQKYTNSLHIHMTDASLPFRLHNPRACRYFAQVSASRMHSIPQNDANANESKTKTC